MCIYAKPEADTVETGRDGRGDGYGELERGRENGRAWVTRRVGDEGSGAATEPPLHKSCA
ncbi:hypothetical protein X777_13350 [Ooceraea biroi]|uniref:Uncharacterized protein n=1 Tax=Ooceraea biroi TaxID=2015173 RepID=A0A026WX04_OOCBI|nr:hypothetical protein X777_13350 [Ooceraea biroi]